MTESKEEFCEKLWKLNKDSSPKDIREAILDMDLPLIDGRMVKLRDNIKGISLHKIQRYDPINDNKRCAPKRDND